MLARQGLYLGFGGACTFKGAKRAAKAIATLPLEQIVLETDCPYMAPEPVRGIRCDSSLIRYVGEYAASVKASARRKSSAKRRRTPGLFTNCKIQGIFLFLYKFEIIFFHKEILL